MKTINKFLLVFLLVISPFCWAGALHHRIVIDAGSSGSRLHLFQYQVGAIIPDIKDVYSESVKPGLSSFADQPIAAGESLKKLLDHAKEELQKNGVDLNTVTVDVLATAGMRLLPESTQQTIYAEVKNYVHDHYSFSVGEVKTISGKMEGIYGWLDINYLSGNFQNHRPTLGSIDMGGASTQIVFVTTDSSKPEDELSLKIGEQSYLVFSKSFLGLGMDQALNTMLVDPAAMSCFPADYPVGQKEVGSFNLFACHKAYQNVIKLKQVAEQLPVIPEAQQFLGYSGIYYNYHFFEIEQTPDQASFESRISYVCSKPWDQLQREYPEIPTKYLSSYCASGVYIDTLLYSTYQLKKSQLIVADQIQQQPIDWTLGAVLYKLIQQN